MKHYPNARHERHAPPQAHGEQPPSPLESLESVPAYESKHSPLTQLDASPEIDSLSLAQQAQAAQFQAEALELASPAYEQPTLASALGGNPLLSGTPLTCPCCANLLWLPGEQAPPGYELQADSGESRAVTMLFFDLRGSCGLFERRDRAKVGRGLRLLFDAACPIIERNGGTLVDFTGDGLCAMWGAPDENPCQERRACIAAQEMLAVLPYLNTRWGEILGEPLRLGIGINSGPAFIGNIGSSSRFKLGALGPAVNLASRVQGATKHFGVTALITGETAAQLDSSFPTRRLGLAKVVGVSQPVQIHELFSPDCPYHRQARDQYERALVLFENHQFAEAVRSLAEWVHLPHDGPAKLLLRRASEALADGPTRSHPVFELPGK